MPQCVTRLRAPPSPWCYAGSTENACAINRKVLVKGIVNLVAQLQGRDSPGSSLGLNGVSFSGGVMKRVVVNERLFMAVLAALLVALAAPVLTAQSLTTGDIAGTVRDPSGAV